MILKTKSIFQVSYTKLIALNFSTPVLILSLGNHRKKPRHSSSPELVVVLVLALELNDSSILRPQSKVTPLLSSVQQVPSRPGCHVPAHIIHHICPYFQKQPLLHVPQVPREKQLNCKHIIIIIGNEVPTLFLLGDSPGNMFTFHL